MSKFKYTVTKEDVELELAVRDILRKKFSLSSRLRNKIKKAELVFLNEESVSHWFLPKENDIVSVSIPKEINTFQKENIPLDIVFEDEDLLVINKPSGIVAHPTKGQPCHTLTNGIAYYMEQQNQSYKIRFINRIDMDTSGIILISKNSYCQDIVTKEMQKGQVDKQYLALVLGVFSENSGTIDLPIGRPSLEQVSRAVMPEGQPSVTHYKVIETFSDKYSLISLKLETGRTHQIRVHLSHIGHPIVGDYLYGGNSPTLIERQALHASSLTLTHPMTKKRMTFEATLPIDIQAVISKLSVL